MSLSSRQIEYIRWQNRAFDFYVAARCLYRSSEYRAAAHCSFLALELLLKATLIYYDHSFLPERAGHRISGMMRALGNKVPGGSSLAIPDYFHQEQRYLVVARYPVGDRGLGIPATFLADLDGWFCGLVKLVPFQFNTLLKARLADGDRRARLRLTGANSKARSLRRFLGVRVRVAKSGRAV